MRFLADESCDFAAVRALRSDGHDVVAVSEFQQRSVDAEVIELALAENRVLITEDKDFGWLVFAARKDSPGVILIRFPASARRSLGPAVLKFVREYGSPLTGDPVQFASAICRTRSESTAYRGAFGRRNSISCNVALGDGDGSPTSNRSTACQVTVTSNPQP